TSVTKMLTNRPMSSGRFAIATHALALLSTSSLEDRETSSDHLAGSINTNPAFLRRLLSSLARAGLVEAHAGPKGGYRLSRAADRISLCDVYRALEPEGAIGESPCRPNPRCPIGAGIRSAFAEAAKAGNEGLLRALHEQTIADVARRAEQ